MKIKFYLFMLLCNVALLQASDSSSSSDSEVETEEIDLFRKFKRREKYEKIYKQEKRWYEDSRQKSLDQIKALKSLATYNHQSIDKKRQEILNVIYVTGDFYSQKVKDEIREKLLADSFIIQSNNTIKAYLGFDSISSYKLTINDKNIEECIELLISPLNERLQRNDKRYPFFAQKRNAKIKKMNLVAEAEKCAVDTSAEETQETLSHAAREPESLLEALDENNIGILRKRK